MGGEVYLPTRGVSGVVVACGFRFGHGKLKFHFLWRGFLGRSFYRRCCNVYKDDLLACRDTVDQKTNMCRVPLLLILDSGNICTYQRCRGGCFLYYIRIVMRGASFLGSFLFREFALSRDDSGN